MEPDQDSAISRKILLRQLLQRFIWISLAVAILGLAALSIIPPAWRLLSFAVPVSGFLGAWVLALIDGRIKSHILIATSTKSAKREARAIAGKGLTTIPPKAWGLARTRGLHTSIIATSFAVPLCAAIVLSYTSGWPAGMRAFLVFFPFPVSVTIAIIAWRLFLRAMRRCLARERYFATLFDASPKRSDSEKPNPLPADDVLCAWIYYWNAIQGLFAYGAGVLLLTFWFSWLAVVFRGQDELRSIPIKLICVGTLLSPLGLASWLAMRHCGAKLRRNNEECGTEPAESVEQHAARSSAEHMVL